MCGLRVERMGLNGGLAPNVAVRRSMGRRSVLFILEAADAGSNFFCTPTITSSSCWNQVVLNSDRLRLLLLSYPCEVDTVCL